MSVPDLKLKMSASQRDNLHKRLGYLRCWIAGFEAAGKAAPHDSDVLRQVQLLLQEAK